MNQYWKLFADWVIDLKNDPFQWAKIKLTIFYTAILVATVAAHLFLVGQELNRNALLFAKEGIKDPAAKQRFIKRSDYVVKQTLLGIGPEDIGMLLSIVFSSYLLSTITLRPLRKVMQQQKQFMVNASHELRTPLAIVRIELETFLRNKNNYVKSSGNMMLREEQSVLNNLEEVKRMGEIIEELSLIARIDAHADIFRFSRVNLGHLVERSISIMKLYAKSNHVMLSWQKGKPLFIHADADKLQQAFLNILKNAIDYSRKNGKVKVSLVKDGNRAVVLFTDYGIGIAKKDLPFVFNRFFRSSATINRIPGTGLGLAITKWIIERHKGKISIQSMPGEGTSVAISLRTL